MSAVGEPEISQIYTTAINNASCQSSIKLSFIHTNEVTGKKMIEPRCPNCQKVLIVLTAPNLTNTYITCPDSILTNPDDSTSPTGALKTFACWPYLVDLNVLKSGYTFKSDNTNWSVYIPRKCNKPSHQPAGNALVKRMLATYGTALERSPIKAKFDEDMKKLEMLWKQYQLLKKEAPADENSWSTEQKEAIENAHAEYCRFDWEQIKKVGIAQQREYATFKTQQKAQNVRSNEFAGGKRKFVRPTIADEGHDVLMQKQKTNAEGIITICLAEGSNMFGRMTYNCVQYNCSAMIVLGNLPLNKNLVYDVCIQWGEKNLQDNAPSLPRYTANCIPFAVIKKYELTSKVCALENACSMLLAQSSAVIDFDFGDDAEPAAKKVAAFNSLSDMWS